MKKLALFLPFLLLGCATHNAATCQQAIKEVERTQHHHKTFYEDAQGNLQVRSAAEEAGSAGAAVVWLLLNGCTFD